MTFGAAIVSTVPVRDRFGLCAECDSRERWGNHRVCLACWRKARLARAIAECPPGLVACTGCYHHLTPDHFERDGKQLAKCAKCREKSVVSRRNTRPLAGRPLPIHNPLNLLLRELPAINPAPLRWVA